MSHPLRTTVAGSYPVPGWLELAARIGQPLAVLRAGERFTLTIRGARG